ncbi:TIGR03826 family flagellar region protein [Oceanobacillus bengalensis]|uniref:TIGR03826 family flagellar region protein n=1 Tax=Oceanobacillus bengalensis TaxID=1435466 RepID=UPI00362E027A
MKNIRDICPACYREEENAYQTVYQFLRKQKNRQATMYEIVEATGVEEWYITKFIKEKRLLPSQFPNLNYPCERCMAPITSGKLCTDCTSELKKELDIQEEIENRNEKLHSEEKEAAKTYFTLNKRRD